MFCEQLGQLRTMVDSTHYAPKVLDDVFSESVYNLFVKSLDQDNKFLTKEDLNGTEIHKLELDNYINNKSCAFIKDFTQVLSKKVKRVKTYLEDIRNMKLDYSGNDTLYYDNENYYRPKSNDQALKKYWTKRVRYKMISKLIDKDSIYTSIEKQFKALEQENLSLIIDNELCLLNEIENQNGGIRRFVEETFLNAYLKYQDPNSSYFNASDKKSYETALANSQLSFGISTRKNRDGNIIVANIALGSPAYKHGEIEINDIIVSLSSKTETLDTNCISNDDIVDFINKDQNSAITFKIKKQNGALLDIELTKSVVDVSENSIIGFIIEHTKKIGYLKIPSFYTDLESPNGLGVANDVAKEIYKLQKENIEGLIIDLRFNGGGSMKEASDLSGMFINRGPLAIAKYRNNESYTIRDSKRGTVFSKPMVILINYFSASASEFFAAAMQDYNRAVIVGTSTHGKATAQVILPIDPDGQLGYARLTVEQFYRVTGKSHQSLGVVPDIRLPSIYDDFETSEAYMSFVLPNDSTKVTLKANTLNDLPISKLQQQSKERSKRSEGFESIKLMNSELIKNYVKKKIQYPLTLNNIYNDIQNYKNLWNKFTGFQDNLKGNITVKNTQSTAEVFEYSTEGKNSNEIQLKDISKDLYINEAYLILTDLLNTKL